METVIFFFLKKTVFFAEQYKRKLQKCHAQKYLPALLYPNSRPADTTHWDLILVQHQYNNCTTTPHMRVGPSMWDSPSCEGLLYSCCIGVVNLTFFLKKKKDKISGSG
jgi:hypothetical protein